MAWQTTIADTGAIHLTTRLVGTVEGSGSGSGSVGKGGTKAATVTGVALPKQSTTDVLFSVGDMDGTVTDALIGVFIIHQAVGDLELRLLSPLGTSVVIYDNRGANGDNIGTQSALCIFDDSAATAIAAGAAPFNGVFRPDNPMTAFNGQDPDGTWKLRVVNSGGHDGTLSVTTLLVGTTSQDHIGGGRLTGQLWPR